MPTSDVQPTWNLVTDVQQLFAYHFMQNAFLAGTLIALIAGAVGYFMVLRGQSFAGHTLANVGFAGALGAVFVGWSPVVGLLVFCIGAAIGIGVLSRNTNMPWGQGVAIGTIQTFALGLGVLFVQLSSSHAAGVYAILFGAVLGISDRDVSVIAITAVVTLAGLLAIARPLLFASVDPDVAEARGVPVRLLDNAFLVLLAFAVAQAVQVVGVLLIFALLVTPAAIAQQITARPAVAVGLCVLLALLFTWAGLAVAYFTPYPVGFFITSFAFGTYVLVRLLQAGRFMFARRARYGAK
jgi:zinc/manganese transport system permease protein